MNCSQFSQTGYYTINKCLYTESVSLIIRYCLLLFASYVCSCILYTLTDCCGSEKRYGIWYMQQSKDANSSHCVNGTCLKPRYKRWEAYIILCTTSLNSTFSSLEFMPMCMCTFCFQCRNDDNIATSMVKHMISNHISQFTTVYTHYGYNTHGLIFFNAHRAHCGCAKRCLREHIKTEIRNSSAFFQCILKNTIWMLRRRVRIASYFFNITVRFTVLV